MNPDLAGFLESLPADSGADFYRGEIASTVSRDMRDSDGLLTADDLAAYAVVEREPLDLSYRSFRLLTNPPPSFGGSLLALSLRLLETQGMDGLAFGDALHLALLIAVMQEVDRRRDAGCLGEGSLSAEDWRESEGRVRRASGGTTHVSVCDCDGNVASLTTSNGEGSGYFAAGTGIMLNNMMGEDDLHPDGFHRGPAGLRVASMMAPSVLLEGDDVRLVLGSGGSKRIRSALLQAVSGWVDFGRTPRELVDAPRVHWDGERVQVEPGFEPAALERLRERWPTNEWSVLDVYFGGVNVVAPDGAAAGDPRRGGTAIVLP